MQAFGYQPVYITLLDHYQSKHTLFRTHGKKFN